MAKIDTLCMTKTAEKAHLKGRTNQRTRSDWSISYYRTGKLKEKSRVFCSS